MSTETLDLMLTLDQGELDTQIALQCAPPSNPSEDFQSADRGEKPPNRGHAAFSRHFPFPLSSL